ncbi:MAG: M28 family metallopeptidase [Promethearchaeota archaeon]
MFDKTQIKKFLESFSFPRLYGTDAEKKGLEIIQKRFDELNIKYTIQKFQFSDFYSRYYGQIMFTLTFWLLFIMYLNISGTFTILNLFIIVILIMALILITKKPERIKIGKIFGSSNLYGKIESSAINRNANSKKEVIFIAHLDSKGQRFDITNRVKIFIVWAYSLLNSIILIILKNYFFPQYALILFIFGGFMLGLNFFSVILYWMNNVSNHSDGALDDASGVACVCELVNYYSKSKSISLLENLNIWFVLTGAEECGTQGVRRFYEIIKSSEKEDILIMNFDSIGTKVDLIKFGLTTHNSFKYQEIFLRKAKELNLDIKTRRCPIGVHTDGYYLFKKGYRGLEFGDWESYRYLHSSQDTIDKVDPSLLAKVCQLVVDSLNEINKIL